MPEARAMRWSAVVPMVLQAASGFAQDVAPIGFLRGEVLAWTGSARTGEVTFRNSDNRVYRCGFDGKTYLERSNQRITVSALQPADRVEILADRKDGTGLCYARTIHVLDAQPQGLIGGVRPRLRSSSGPTEVFAPRGDMTFSGMVLRVDSNVLMLRTRRNEYKTIHLRSDTRFLGDGQSLDRSTLGINTRVFVRGGKNLDDEIEAYQVIWGSILQP